MKHNKITEQYLRDIGMTEYQIEHFDSVVSYYMNKNSTNPDQGVTIHPRGPKFWTLKPLSFSVRHAASAMRGES